MPLVKVSVNSDTGCSQCVCVCVLESVFAAFGLKLVLNGVSTGANILKGRVFTNEMINLRLSNDKVHLYCFKITTSTIVLSTIVLSTTYTHTHTRSVCGVAV